MVDGSGKEKHKNKNNEDKTLLEKLFDISDKISEISTQTQVNLTRITEVENHLGELSKEVTLLHNLCRRNETQIKSLSTSLLQYNERVEGFLEKVVKVWQKHQEVLEKEAKVKRRFLRNFYKYVILLIKFLIVAVAAKLGYDEFISLVK